MKYFYPIVLKNKKLKLFKLSSNILIRRISNTERVAFFGFKKIDFGFTGGAPMGYVGWCKFSPSKKKGRMPYSNIRQVGLFDKSSDILASNYVIEIDTEKSPDFLIDRINLSLALNHPTSSGGFIGFREKET